MPKGVNYEQFRQQAEIAGMSIRAWYEAFRKRHPEAVMIHDCVIVDAPEIDAETIRRLQEG